MSRLTFAALLLAGATSLAAQDVTSDLQQLQDSTTAVAADIAQARSRDAAQGAELERELADIRDDIA
jgi:hypothetical protein